MLALTFIWYFAIFNNLKIYNFQDQFSKIFSQFFFGIHSIWLTAAYINTNWKFRDCLFSFLKNIFEVDYRQRKNVILDEQNDYYH